MTVIRSWNWLLSWLVAVWIHLTEATDTVYSFYLQHNMSISAISTRQKIRSSTLFQLRCITTTFACSIVHVLQADSMPLLSETRLHTVISHIVHLHMRTVTYATTVKLSITVNHQHIRPCVHCSRPPRRGSNVSDACCGRQLSKAQGSNVLTATIVHIVRVWIVEYIKQY